MTPRHPARSANRPVGHATRGTTGTNRLRRNDRYLAHLAAFRRADNPIVIDLGFGASAVTALELWQRLGRVRRDVEVIGIEIDSERVARANEQLDRVRAGLTGFSPDARVSFVRGGFEVPLPDGRRPTIVRAMNVLRQYDEADVADAWALAAARLAPGGLLVEGTCDEIGRVASWIDIADDATPQRFTLSLRIAELDDPRIVAERLPKALIHHNVPGERVHALLEGLSGAWAAAPRGFGNRQRWEATLRAVKASGMPVLTPRARERLGELTVPWEAVAPA